MDSHHKGLVTSKLFPFDDVIMHIPMPWRVLLQYHTKISVTWAHFYTLNGGDGNGDGDGDDDDGSDGDGHDDYDRDVGHKHEDDDDGDASEKITKRKLGTRWGWMTHIYVRKIAIIGPDNGLSPDRC